MGRQIIKQPNGKYCIFSTVVDNITHYDCTEDQIIELWANEQKEEITKRVKDDIEKLERGEKPYRQLTKSYDEAISFIGEIHGKEEMNNVKNTIEAQ